MGFDNIIAFHILSDCASVRNGALLTSAVRAPDLHPDHRFGRSMKHSLWWTFDKLKLSSVLLKSSVLTCVAPVCVYVCSWAPFLMKIVAIS